MFAASKSGKAAAAAASTDASFAYVPLLLETTGTNGQQNNTFLDSSTNAFTITRNGTPTQGSITPYWPNGQWSNYFNGTSDRFSLGTGAALNPGTIFTFECWIYSTGTTTNSSLFEGTTGGLSVTFNGSNQLSVAQSGVGYLITDPTAFVLTNQWVHIAVARSGTTLSLYKNGSRVATSASNATVFSTVTQNYIAFNGGSAYFPGYISNLRLVKGTAVYDPTLTTLTVPTTPLTPITNTSLLICQSNRFVDNASSPNTITLAGTPSVQAFQPFSPAASYSAATYAGSGYFNGSTDYLSETDLTPITFGTGDFTIEFWHYLISKATAYPVLFNVSGNSTTTNSRIEFDATHNISGPTSYNVYAPGVIINAGTVAYNTWSHIALVRSSNTLTLYLNGVSIGSANVAGTSYGGTGNGLRLMGDGGANDYAYGYLSNFRIVKGTAVYTAAFTPPTAPVTAITNTSLLLNMANAGIYDAAAQNDITTVGGVQVATTPTPKWPPSSTSFNGSTGYLTIPTNTALVLGAADFTIEGWVYFNTVAGAQTIWDQRPAATNGAYPVIYMNGAVMTWYVNSAAQITSGSLTTGVWYYFAVTRASSVTKMFINGSQVGSNYTDTNTYLAGQNLIGIANSSAAFLNGYLQDFRITRGVGRTITASPTAAFPTR